MDSWSYYNSLFWIDFTGTTKINMAGLCFRCLWYIIRFRFVNFIMVVRSHPKVSNSRLKSRVGQNQKQLSPTQFLTENLFICLLEQHKQSVSDILFKHFSNSTIPFLPHATPHICHRSWNIEIKLALMSRPTVSVEYISLKHDRATVVAVTAHSWWKPNTNFYTLDKNSFSHTSEWLKSVNYV